MDYKVRKILQLMELKIMKDNITNIHLIKIEEKLAEHMTLLATIQEQNKTIFKRIDELHEQLFGNGQEGICDTLTKHSVYFRIIGASLIIIVTALTGKLFNLI